MKSTYKQADHAMSVLSLALIETNELGIHKKPEPYTFWNSPFGKMFMVTAGIDIGIILGWLA